MTHIRNLGRALTIIAAQEASEHVAHAAADAFLAPSEIHGLVAKSEARRYREARRHAEAVAQRPLRIIKREARRRGFAIGGRRWDELVSRIMASSGYPF